MIPTVGPEFVCRMEDVLDLYAEAYDPARPVVCFDETSKQLIAETRVPLPMVPGKPERVDYEYERKGTANLFLVTQPLGAWRHVDVTDQRTKHDFALQMRDRNERRASTRDKRNKELFLTAKGVSLLRRAHPIAWAIQDRILYWSDDDPPDEEPGR